jgi:DNA-binding SARP family transcriptional activator
MTITSAGRWVRYKVLGELEAVGPAGSLRPGRSRPGALLALLLVHAGETVTSSRVLHELWSHEQDPGSSKRVQVNVVRLRRALGTIAPAADSLALVRTRTRGYLLDVDCDCVDAFAFARLAARGRASLAAGDAPGAARDLRAALALWRGEPYADFADEEFAQAEIRHLQELHLTALEDWAAAEIELGGHARIAADLQRLVARNPLRERMRALHMLALYRSRRQGEALAAYHAARRTFITELGIEPGRELRELEQAILEQRPSLEPAGGRDMSAARVLASVGPQAA